MLVSDVTSKKLKKYFIAWANLLEAINECTFLAREQGV
jgi:hypothetical protein